MSSESTEPEERPSKRLFIISPIGDPGSDTRIRADQVKKYIIDPIAEEMDYETCRADVISEPGRITDQIVERLINDDLVVADLTDHNPNVFYELAVRHAKGEPVVLLILRGQKIPFDVSAQRVIFYDNNDLDSVDEAKAELRRQIMAVASNDFTVDSPIRMHIPIPMSENEVSANDQTQEIINILRNQSMRLSEIYTSLNNLSSRLKRLEIGSGIEIVPGSSTVADARRSREMRDLTKEVEEIYKMMLEARREIEIGKEDAEE